MRDRFINVLIVTTSFNHKIDWTKLGQEVTQ